MYRIFCDDELLYDPNVVDDGYDVKDATVTEELNTAGSCEFTVPMNNKMYDKLYKLKSIIRVCENDTEIFRGRILQTTRDFYNNKKVYCEGELAYLCDTILSPYTFTGSPTTLLGNMIESHNAQSGYKFVAGNVTVTDPNDNIVRSSESYVGTFDEMKSKLFGSTLGGYIKLRGDGNTRYIDYLTQYGKQSSQVIEFGKNLLDFQEFIDASQIFTCLIPLGADGLTVKSVNDESDMLINYDALDTYGKIVRVQEWSDVTVASNLLAKGNDFLSQGINAAVTITINAIDMHLLDVNTEKINLGDSIRCISLPHKVDDYFSCSKIVTNLQNPDKTQYILGTTKKGITDA